MTTYLIKNSPAEKEYSGYGKAWASIDNDEVVALRYMKDFVMDYSKVPSWVQAARKSYLGLANFWTDVRYISSYDLGKIKKAAIAAGHPEVGPRGGYIKASLIARESQRLIQIAQDDQFGEYRIQCRDDLEKLGQVKSGMCSCGEFITDM